MSGSCAITGSNGYVGGCLKKYLAARGREILELTRRPAPDARAAAFRLGAEVSPETLAGADTLVHCAYDFQPLRWQEIQTVNVDGTRKLLQAARARWRSSSARKSPRTRWRERTRSCIAPTISSLCIGQKFKR